jgi:hypothetical protein
METKKIVLLRDYTLDGAVKSRPPPTVVNVACATMSSSLFCEPVTLGGARRYAGGDLGANNPINQVELEALNLWKMDRGFQPQCLVSIGAGNPGNSKIETDFWYLLANTMREIATETEGTAFTFALRFQHLMKSDNKSYFRFNVEQGLQQFAMLECDEEQIALIQATTEGYMDNAVQRIEIEQCAALLQLREVLPLEEKPSRS